MGEDAGAEFRQREMVRCRFAGKLRKVMFDGRDLPPDRPGPPQMKGVDFSEAIFEKVRFMGFDLEDIRFPQDPDLRLVRRYRCVVERALPMLEPDESPAARTLRAVLSERLRMMQPDQRESEEIGVFNRRDYLAIGGEALGALAAEVFTRAEAECRRGGQRRHRDDVG